MAQVVETVINNIRNRVNHIDAVEDYCPNPNLSWIMGRSANFVSFLLGPSANQAIGRDRQAGFSSTGDVVIPKKLRNQFGRMVLLGSLRADTELQAMWNITTPDYANTVVSLVIDERDEAEAAETHYYSLMEASWERNMMYGQYGVYVDQIKADEEIRISVKSQQ